MLNQIILIGRLTDDPELNYTNQGTPVANFTLAVQRNNGRGDKNNSQDDADFIPVVAWDRRAEVTAEYLNKGRLVAISGRLKLEKNETEKFTYINPKVTAYNIQFLDSQDSSESADGKSQEKAGFGENSGVPESFNNNVGASNTGSIDDIEVPF